MSDVRANAEGPIHAQVAIIGGGPAGLIAAQKLLEAGFSVDLFDSQRSVGRKFLLAGIGGLNLTHSVARPLFDEVFFEGRDWVSRWLDSFDAEALREWASSLGVETFVGTSGRVFPLEKKAAPLLRRWLAHMRSKGLRIHTQHKWVGWSGDELVFENGVSVRADATLLALGGASWPQLGSDAAWVSLLGARGVEIAPLKPANCGFNVAWSEHLRARYSGSPLKPIAINGVQGEAVLTEYGIEGSALYPAVPALREGAPLYLDILPHFTAEEIDAKLATRGSRSLSDFMKRTFKLDGGKLGLVNEFFRGATPTGHSLKNLQIPITTPRPIKEVISTAGGIPQAELTPQLELRKLPGIFCAGEMLDWEAPTGGYLLTACFASGVIAAEGLKNHLSKG